MAKYTAEFFEKLESGSARSAKAIVPMIMSLLHPNTVIDIGCGSGAWLHSFKTHGAAVFGIDGFSDIGALQLEPTEFRNLPLEEPLPELSRTFDLAVALEVAEHLPPERATTFVADLVRLAPAVLFSAAIPGQGGTHHLNEQWPDYWAAMFAQHHFVCVDFIRLKLWEDANVDWWYAQNTLLYIRGDRVVNDPTLLASQQGLPHRLVHPSNYMRLLHPVPPTLSVATLSLIGALRRSLKFRFGV